MREGEECRNARMREGGECRNAAMPNTEWRMQAQPRILERRGAARAAKYKQNTEWNPGIAELDGFGNNSIIRFRDRGTAPVREKTSAREDSMSFCDHCEGQRFDRAQVLRALRAARKRLPKPGIACSVDQALAMAIEAVRALEIPHLERVDDLVEGEVIH